MRILFTIAFAVLCLAACAPAPSESDRLNAWFEQRYEEQLMASPIELTLQGRKERYGELDDFSLAAQDAQLERQRQWAAQMRREFDYNALDDATKESWDLWMHQYEEAEADASWRTNQYIFHQMTGVHSFLPTFMISFHAVESVGDMEDYIARLHAISVAIRQLIKLAQDNAAAGTRPPRFAYDIVAEQARALASGQPFDGGDDHALWSDARDKIAALEDSGAIDAATAGRLRADARAALLESLGPAYMALADWLDADRPNTGATAQGVHALPDGERFYRHQLATITTTGLSADEIHQIGLDEVARIHGEMERLKERAGYGGTLQEFFAMVRDSVDDPRFYYPNDDSGRQGYIDDATSAINNIEAQLPDYFGILPKAGLVVKRVEPFREQDGAPQHYFPGTPDGSRSGIYYAHLSDMKAMPKNQLEVIAYHEGLPGHHMQISIAQELQGVPKFRTQAGFTAYSEGWALYSEKLASEMPDTYESVYSDFGRLVSEIWRAIRLVVDTGMHAKGWSQQRAVQYFADNSPENRTTIETEVRRYLVLPGQATAYKVGMLEIQRLRRLAERELGADFDIRAFHDTILGGGALPLNMLEKRVHRWIKTTQTQ